MKTERLNAFTDGVLAIVITIMVLERSSKSGARPSWPTARHSTVDGEESKVKAAVGSRHKEWISFIGYSSALPLAFVSPYISVAIYVAVSAMWLVPDRRFERWR